MYCQRNSWLPRQMSRSSEVIEFDNKPAAVAYAEALGIAVEDAPDTFMHNPVGLVIDGEPYVRSPQQIKDNKMLFYCGVIEGMELSILESTNIIEDTKEGNCRCQNEAWFNLGHH